MDTPPNMDQLRAEAEKLRAERDAAIKKETKISEDPQAPRSGSLIQEALDMAQKEKTRRDEKKAKEAEPFNPEKEVSDFITEYELESSLAPEFAELSKEAKLMVIHSLKQRIIDIVKSDAQTQYSEEVGKKQFLGKIRAGINKNFETKKLETKVFKEFLNSEEGKGIIKQNLTHLIETTSQREVEVGEGNRANFVYVKVEDLGGEEAKETAARFNRAANVFRNVPYEWGQEKSGKHKKKYDAAKTVYEAAQGEVLKWRATMPDMGKEKAMTEVLQSDNILRYDQLLNTHPEVEGALKDLGNDSRWKGQVKDLLHTITGGNTTAFVGGFGARMAAGLAGVATLVAAPIIGGGIGYWRGKVRAKESLEERKLQARHGIKDTSKEANKVLRAEDMTKYLEKIIADLEGTNDEKKKAALFNRLQIRIDVTRSKIEQGLMDFGNTKNIIVTQANLVSNLNRAVVLTTYASEEVKKEVEQRVENILSFRSENINKTQKTYVSKQAKKAALLGAGFALAGYGVRYLMEHTGGVSVGGETHGITHDSTKVDTLQHARVDSTKIDSIKVAGLKPDTAGAAVVAAQPGIPGTGIASTINQAPGTGHELTQVMEFKVRGPIEHAYEKLILNHLAHTDLDQEHATRALNEAANMARLTAGHNTAGITVEEFNKAFSYHDGVLKILDPKAADHIMDRLHEHSGGILDMFKNDPNSATGYTKHVDWHDRELATGMNPTTTEPGIIGHPDATIEDFSHIPDPHEIITAEARARVIESMEGKSPAIELVSNGEISDHMNNVPDHTVTAEELLRYTPEHHAGNVTPNSSPINPETGSGVNTTGEGYRPYNSPYGNVFNTEHIISSEMTREINRISSENINHLFPENPEEVWGAVKDGPADEMMTMNNPEEGLELFYKYIHHLQELTDGNVKPLHSVIGRAAETNGAYVKRALEYIALHTPEKLAETKL